jgi:SRSO17 transposase
MDAGKLTKLQRDLTSFLDDVAGSLGHPRRRRWCETYLRGLLLDGQRKSIEPMATRLKEIEQGPEDYEQALQQFINQSPWDEQALLDALQTWIRERFAADSATGDAGKAPTKAKKKRGDVTTKATRTAKAAAEATRFLILDDTGFPKQGKHSVGVARQYTGTLGKVGSCQVAVTLQFATDRDVVALDAQLYLPQVWTEDLDRCRAAGIPESVGYQPKWQIALDMLRRAQANGLSGIVLADSGFGTTTEFREQLAAAGGTYCVGIDSTLKVIDAETDLGEVPPSSGSGRPPTRPRNVRAGATSPSVRQWAVEHAGDFRRVTWREGTKGKMTGRFAAWRVRPAHRLSAGRTPLSACWLLVEWPADAEQPAKFFFSNQPATTSLKTLVRTAKSRWWIEHSYRELKDELGLDHFEGRSWRGWRHHVVLVLLAYAFLQGLRRDARPSKKSRRTRRSGSV